MVYSRLKVVPVENNSLQSFLLVCRPGWNLAGANGTCYKVINDAATLEEARDICGGADALVATPRDQEEQDFLHTVAYVSISFSLLKFLFPLPTRTFSFLKSFTIYR